MCASFVATAPSKTLRFMLAPDQLNKENERACTRLEAAAGHDTVMRVPSTYHEADWCAAAAVIRPCYQRSGLEGRHTIERQPGHLLSTARHNKASNSYHACSCMMDSKHGIQHYAPKPRQQPACLMQRPHTDSTQQVCC